MKKLNFMEKLRKNLIVALSSICILLISVSLTNAQTTKTVGGAGADYATLRDAFNDINKAIITGEIILQITGSTTETLTADLGGCGACGSGEISYIEVTNGGDYSGTPTVIIGNLWTASTAYSVGEQIYQGTHLYTVTVGGTSGATAPTHTSGTWIDNGVEYTYAGARAFATSVIKSGNALIAILISNPGFGYTSAPPVSFSGGGTVLAQATAVAYIANYTSVLVYPTVSGLSISGNIQRTEGLLRLNGADNVTIDGRVNATGSTPNLTIENQSTGNGHQTIHFINSAESNTVKYSFVKGANAGTSSGVIAFTTASVGGDGNRNNIIEHCRITNSNGNRPNIGIFSEGSASRANSNIIIRNNHIYNIVRGGSQTTNSGVSLQAHSPGWEIRDNHFYEESVVTFDQGATNINYYNAIILGSNPGGALTNTAGVKITGNFIGGSAPNSGGTDKFRLTGAGTGARIAFRGIMVSGAGANDVIEIENNTIANISVTNSNRTTTGDPFNLDFALFAGIQIHQAKTIVKGNTIGSTTVAESIVTGAVMTGSNAEHALTAGINFRFGDSNIIDHFIIENNLIGGFKTTHNASNRSHSFAGITTYAGATTNINNSFTIKGNTIGSTTIANSILCDNNTTTNGIQEATGIRITRHGNWTISENTIMNLTSKGSRSQAIGISMDGYSGSIWVNGAITIQDNTIAHLKSYGEFTSFGTSPVWGIMYGSSSGIGNGDATISGNTIHNLEALATGHVLNNVSGIYAPGSTVAGQTANIYNNFISDLKIAEGNTNSLAVIAGIIIPNNRPTTNTKTIYNNVISLGNDINKSRYIYGILETSAFGSGYAYNLNVYFNTVYIAGTPNAYSQDSYCLRINSGDNFGNPTRNIRNNILVNARSNTGGASGKHYAIHFTNTTNVTIDYNNYFVDGIGGTLAFWGTDQNTLATLQAANSQDGNSVNTDPILASAGGTNATDYKGTEYFEGTPIVGITTDYEGNLRQATPSMGAFEVGSLTSNVEVVNAHANSNGFYETLKEAFDAINLHNQTSFNIEVKIHASTTETSGAILNAGAWTKLTIYPTSTDLTISGSLSSAIISLNGADNVTIDGRVNQAGTTPSLTIQNTSNASGSSAIYLENSAESNTIRYCNIKAANTSATSGIISFSTSASGNGNSNNTIEYNNISGTSNADNGRSTNAIYSAGSVGYLNSNNTISNNNIFDHHRLSTSSQGINIAGYSTEFTISGNSFYETTSIAFTGTAATLQSIYVANHEGDGYINISGNYFGGQAPQCGGGKFTLTDDGSQRSISYNAIWINSTGLSTQSNITNNTIANIEITRTTNGAPFRGIYSQAGTSGATRTSIGNVTGNIIGAATGIGSIIINTNQSGTSEQYFYGLQIGLRNSGTAETHHISNNVIGSITLSGNVSNRPYFLGIETTGGMDNTNAYIENNLIGSLTTANSINNSTAHTGSGQSVVGFQTTSSGSIVNYYIRNNTIANLNNNTTATGNLNRLHGIRASGLLVNYEISGNTIRNLTCATNNTANQGSTALVGILLSNATGTAMQNTFNNTIHDLESTSLTAAVKVTGIYFQGPTATSTSNIYNNFIHSLRNNAGNTSTSSQIIGIEINSSTTEGSTTSVVRNVYNNVVSLGTDVSSRAIIQCIMEYGGQARTNNYYFNTMYMGGTASGHENQIGEIACFYSFAWHSSNVRNIRNNIMVNARTATGAADDYFCISLVSATGIATTTINYNNYWFTGTGGALGRISNKNFSDLSDWQTELNTLGGVSGKDANSLNIDPVFANAGSTNATDYKGTAYFEGIAIVGITSDYEGNPRQATPSMGAFEVGLVSSLTWNGSQSTDWNNPLNWTPNTVPTSTHSVLIPNVAPNHFPRINNPKLTPAECDNMTINNGAKVTVLISSALTVNKNMLNNGFFEIKSGTGGDGSLIISGTRTGSGNYIIERYFTGAVWHMIHSPIENATASIFTNMFLREFNEGTNSWGNFIVNPSHPLNAGESVSVWTYNDFANVEYNGLINHGSIPMTVSLTGGIPSFNKGHNLIGNPYPSAIQWKPNDASMWSKTNISNTIQIWNPTIGNYTTWNGSFGSAGTGHLALCQGFFVQASGPNPSLSILPEARLHSEVSFKSTQEVEDIISVTVSGNNYNDECFIIYRPDASSNYDFEYDAVKLPGLPEAPQLYSKKMDNGTEINLAVNALNNLEMLDKKLVFLEVGVNTQYTLSFSHSFSQNFNPLVRDRFTDVLIYPNVEYHFTSTPSDNKDRFEILELNNNASVSSFSNDAVQIWEHNNMLYVGNVNTQFHITIYDILGKELIQSVQKVTSLETLPTGVYLVRVVAGNESTVKKISVH